MQWCWRFAATGLVAAFGMMTCPVLTTAEAGPDEARLLLFSSTDIWHQGGFSHGGLLWAPSGLDHQGSVLKLMFGGGVYHYTSGALGDARVRGDLVAGSILPGYRFIHDGLYITVYFGGDFQRHRLSPDDISAGLRGGYNGLRGGFELWYQPTATTMIAADASASTIGPSYDARFAAGWRVFDMCYVGPELQAFAADGNYRQYRLGVHVTGLHTGAFEWSAGVGWATDNDDHDGAYGKVSVFTKR